jgi:hypothetical protein
MQVCLAGVPSGVDIGDRRYLGYDEAMGTVSGFVAFGESAAG